MASRRLLRALGVLVIVAVAALGVMLGIVWWEHAAEITLPAPTGPFAVGRATDVWSTPDPSGGPSREIRDQRVVWIWYPAVPASGSRPAEYLPAPWRAALGQYQGPLIRLVTRDAARVRVHSTEAAAVSPAGAPHPVLIMRAGLGALTTDFTTVAEDLASHGYVVVGFDAPLRTTVVVLSDGRVATRPPENNPETLPAAEAERLAEKLQAQWCADVGFIVDRLDELNRADPSGRFKARLDLQRLGVFGHSLGGAVAAQFCHDDARCKAGVDIDGALHGGIVGERLDRPFMVILSDHGQASDAVSRRILGDLRSFYERLPRDGRVWITVHGAHHFSFSDQALLKSQLLVRLFGRLEARRGLAITADLLRWFFDTHLNAQPNTAPAAPRPVYPEVRFDPGAAY